MSVQPAVNAGRIHYSILFFLRFRQHPHREWLLTPWSVVVLFEELTLPHLLGTLCPEPGCAKRLFYVKLCWVAVCFSQRSTQSTEMTYSRQSRIYGRLTSRVNLSGALCGVSFAIPPTQRRPLLLSRWRITPTPGINWRRQLPSASCN